MGETRWGQGLRAFDEGRHLSDNPYGTCGPAYREWRNGWYRGADEARAIEKERDEAVQKSLEAIGVTEDVSNNWQRLLCEEHRHHHTMEHVTDILHAYDGMGGTNSAIMAAAWMHDIIYNARAFDNEEQSAEIAKLDLHGSNVDIPLVVDLILDTKHHQGGTPERDLFSDLDMMILGKSRPRYIRYMRGIRKEYGHVPLADYAARRAQVMRGFNQRTIFHTEYFAPIETRAHENMEFEIALLEGPIEALIEALK